nr:MULTISPECIES: ATP-binding protein [Allobranchiibius]
MTRRGPLVSCNETIDRDVVRGREGTPVSDEHWVQTLRLPWTIDSVPAARTALVESLGSGGLPEELVGEAETVASELVTNAILHGKPLYDNTVRLHWRVRGDRVEIEVTDGGGVTAPAARRPSVWAQGGRGLRIVRSVAHEWGVNEEDDRVTVWAALGGPSRRRV